MNWNKLITNRHNTYNWSNKIPARELIDQIVEELHTYAPSKQRKVPYYLDVIDNKDYNYNPKLFNLILINKTSIQNKVVEWISQQVSANIPPFDGYKYDRSKCIRDVGYVLSGYANDVKFNSNRSTIRMSKAYWNNGVPQVRQFVEIKTHTYIKELLLNILDSNSIVGESRDHLSSLCDITISVIENGISSIPKVKEGKGNLRFEIFEGTDRKGDGRANDLKNPQVLAPYLFVFSSRTLDPKEIGLNRELHDHIKARNVSENEIGLASMFTVLSATAKKLDTGFCACIRNGNEIAERLGHKNESVILYVGVGYSDPNSKYYCPSIHEHLDIPDSNFDKKPSLNRYYKFIET